MSEPKDRTDVALLCGPAPAGDGMLVLRAREGRVEAGVARPLKDGAALHGGELVRLTPREGTPWLADVKTELSLPAPTPPPAPPTSPTSAHPGPARVTSEPYRDGWARIFGARTPPQAN
ncbi:MAG: hypothetical protein HY909_30140 [Deltaproteobacteria bacterium]|nr:hypothetical protein [Deltaproteobacteria bacterium]